MAGNVILPEQEIGFVLNPDYGLYFTEIYPSAFSLTEGETYTVLWDGVEYICQAGPLQFMGMEWQVIGNKALLGGENTGEPFGIGSSIRDGVPVSDVIATVDTSDSHTVGITLKEPGILLKDHTGEAVEHELPENLQVDLSDGSAVKYVHESLVPELLENVEVTPDFSGGDMVFSAPEGMAVRSGIVRKPENLIPGNIAEGVDIAGIIGTLVTGGSNVKFAYGKLTLTAAQYVSVTTNHGFKPDLIILAFDGYCETKNRSFVYIGGSAAFNAATDYAIGVRNYFRYDSTTIRQDFYKDEGSGIDNGHDQMGINAADENGFSLYRYPITGTWSYVIIGGLV